VRDPYQVLGVGRDASDDEIKVAFRRLAREHHPDRNPDDPDAQRRFTEINAAYQVLGDQDRRQRFEQRYGGPQRGASAGGGFGFSGNFEGKPIEDWLSELLRSGFGAASQTDSGDLEQTLELSFEEAALGCVRQVTYQRRDLCSDCSGTGAAPGTRSRECKTCRGAGRLRLEAMGWLALGMDRPCPECRGTGQIPDKGCSECRGQGLVERRRTINLTIPSGIESGTEETVLGGGHRISPNQAAGDLRLRINVRAHASFRREGDDIESDVTVPFIRAALGGDVEVDTLHGKTSVRIAPGTAHDAQIKLRGKGVPHRFRSGSGDHYCRVKVLVPKVLSPEARRLLDLYDRELAEAEEGGVLARLKGFFSG
jgi:molecular chaperone DnaJ